MKKFWNFVGKVYLFVVPKKKKIIPLLIIIFLILHFAFLIRICFRLNSIQNDLSSTKETLTQSVNKVYSQVYLLNSRMSQIYRK